MSETLLHFRRLFAKEGKSITIIRGTGDSAAEIEIDAVPSQSKATLTGSDGSYQVVIVEDWIVLRSEWTLTPAYPVKGDRIVLEDDTEYRVGHPDAKSTVYTNFNPIDRPALAWTVHTLPK